MAPRKKVSSKMKDMPKKAVIPKQAASVKGGALPGQSRHTWPPPLIK
jgi:hypothetical protein